MSEKLPRLPIIVAEAASVDPAALTDAFAFERDAGMDSLGLLEMAMNIEDAFGIKLSEAEIDEVTTYGELRQLVEGKFA